MPWRSSYLFCPECGSVYFANQIAPVINSGRYFQFCPNALCDHVGELVSLDELMIKPTVELNKKGYTTRYCCSGHDLRGPYDQRGYILFDVGIEVPSAPDGWDIERDDPAKRTCIRSTTDDLAMSIANLNKWVDELCPF